MSDQLSALYLLNDFFLDFVFTHFIYKSCHCYTHTVTLILCWRKQKILSLHCAFDASQTKSRKQAELEKGMPELVVVVKRQAQSGCE